MRLTPLRSPPARPLTVSVCVHHGKSKKRIKVKSGSLRSHPHVAWICVDQGRHLSTAERDVMRRDLSEVGRCGLAGPLAPWARGMPRAGWAGRPTPVLPCAQDSAHEQGAIEPPGVRALCLRSTASQAPERTVASGWAGSRSGVYGVSCQPTPPRHPPGSSCCYCGCRPAAGATAGAGRQPAQAPKRSSSIVISGAAPDWIAAAWLSVRGSTRAK